jgi:predicted DNA-binding transcriptional regulator YafY
LKTRASESTVTQRLNQGFLQQQALAIRYEDAAGSLTDRHIEPHCLLLNDPVWYLLAWDRLREAGRTFRCDRIRRAELLDETFALRPVAVLQEPSVVGELVFP